MSRATLIVDLTFLATLGAPIVSLVSFRAARAKRYAVHRALQTALLLVCVATVLALETQIRLAGGSGAFVSTAPAHTEALARGVLAVHITGAVSTYAAWVTLAVLSWRRHAAGKAADGRAALPGPFSRRHKLIGRAVFGGLAFTAVSAAAVYTLVFVA